MSGVAAARTLHDASFKVLKIYMVQFICFAFLTRSGFVSVVLIAILFEIFCE